MKEYYIVKPLGHGDKNKHMSLFDDLDDAVRYGVSLTQVKLPHTYRGVSGFICPFHGFLVSKMYIGTPGHTRVSNSVVDAVRKRLGI